MDSLALKSSDETTALIAKLSFTGYCYFSDRPSASGGRVAFPLPAFE
jgi:hypothetical protein